MTNMEMSDIAVQIVQQTYRNNFQTVLKKQKQKNYYLKEKPLIERGASQQAPIKL